MKWDIDAEILVEILLQTIELAIQELPEGMKLYTMMACRCRCGFFTTFYFSGKAGGNGWK